MFPLLEEERVTAMSKGISQGNTQYNNAAAAANRCLGCVFANWAMLCVSQMMMVERLEEPIPELILEISDQFEEDGMEE